MPSTYTTNNGIELIGTGEQSGTWGDTTNTNLTLVDASLDGHTSITLTTTGTSGSPNDVPITDGATSNGRNRALIFTDGSDLGGSVYVRLTPNDAKKIMFVRNSLSGSRDLILFQGTYNASNDFVLAAGKDAIVKFDGGGSGAVASAVLADFALDAATITTISNTTLNTATVNATTVDTTNIEVTNLKAKDGTSAGSIADSNGVVTLASSVLTTTDINGGTIDGTTIGGSTPAAVTGTTITGTGFVTTGDMTFGDDDKAIFGDGNDLQIYHDGSNSYIEEAGTGALKVTSNGTGVDFESAGGETLAQFETNGAVTLYYNNSQKLVTTSSGIEVTGRAKIGDGADGGVNADELVASKDAPNVGISILSEDATGFSRLFFGTQTDTAAARLQYEASSDEIILQSGGIVTLQSGGTNDRVTVDSSGNVGIGNTSPSHPLDVSGTVSSTVSSTGDLNFNAVSNGGGNYRIYPDDATTANPTWFHQSNSSEDQAWVIGGVERMRLDSSGNVGIGTNSPTSAALVVSGTGLGSSIRVDDTTNSVLVDVRADSTGGLVRTASNDPLVFATNQNEAMRIDSSGNVGIGGTSPSAELDVTGTGLFSGRVGIGTDLGSNPSGADPDADNLVIDAGGADAGVTIDTGTAAKGSLFFADGGTGDALKRGQIVYDHNGDYMAFATNAVERMRLDASGNVGINTTSPQEELHVVSANGTALRLEATNTATAGGIDFYGKDAGDTTYQAGNINSAGGTGSLEFSADPTDAETNTRVTFLTDGAERVRIDDTGLGIGTTSPAQALDVTGSAAISNKAKVGTGADGSANGDELVLSKAGNNIGMTILCNDATGNSRIYLGSQTDTQAARIQHNESNDRLFVQAKGELHFQTGGTNTTMTLDTSGDLDIDGDFTAAGAVNGTVGVGQTWQDVSGSRSANVSYQNTTGQPIQWAVHGSSGQEAQVSSDGSTWVKVATLGAPGSFETAATPVIPDNYYYRTTGAFSTWAELR